MCIRADRGEWAAILHFLVKSVFGQQQHHWHTQCNGDHESRPRGQITGSGYWVYLRDLCMTVASPNETQNNTGIARGSQTIYRAHWLGRILRVESQECCFGTRQFGSEANLMQVLPCIKILFGRYYGGKCCVCRK